MRLGTRTVNHNQIFWDQLLDLIAGGHVIPIIGRDVLSMPSQEGKTFFYPFLAKRLAEPVESVTRRKTRSPRPRLHTHPERLYAERATVLR